MSRKRVAITGIGLVSGLGLTREENWTRMLAAECAVRPVTLFDASGYRSGVAGEVRTDELHARLTPLERRRLSRADQIGLLASREAVEDARVIGPELDRGRAGVLMGAGTADLLRNENYFFTMRTDGIAHARPSQAWNHFSSTPVDIVAGELGFEGARSCVVAACSSSTIAIGQAASLIRGGRLDVAIAGGTDALSRLTFSGFNALRLMDAGPCRPFDTTRSGMNIGEGAGMLVLEDYDRATRRGATIYAELAGYALACEAFHPTAPEPEGRVVASIVRMALADAGAGPDDVDHINAHGTATPQNDLAEAKGFYRALGDRARDVPVTSLKSLVGHCLGAAGAVEAAALALTIARGVIPPTANHVTRDPECNLDVVTEARAKRVGCGVSTSLAFGGNDSALVIRAV
ncbi:MAG: beta-ketoacyl synthase [Vicinamibacterales bacterium]